MKIDLNKSILLFAVIIVINTQSLLPINYYLPGTILFCLMLIRYFTKGSINLGKDYRFIFGATGVYWLSQILLNATGLSGYFFTTRFTSILILLLVAIKLNEVHFVKSPASFIKLTLAWFVDIIWSRVEVSQGLKVANRIMEGDAYALEGMFVNRFFLGIIFCIIIYLFVSSLKFNHQLPEVHK